MTEERVTPGCTSRGTICFAMSGVKKTRSKVRFNGNLITSPRLNVITFLSYKYKRFKKISKKYAKEMAIYFKIIPAFQSQVLFCVVL